MTPRCRELTRSIAVLAGALLLVSLSGCDPIGSRDAPLAIRGAGDSGVEVYICGGIKPSHVLVEYRSKESEWKTILEARGNVPTPHVGTTDLVSSITTSRSVTYGSESEFSVLVNTSENGSSVTGYYTTATKLPAKRWLLANGRTSSRPCR